MPDTDLLEDLLAREGRLIAAYEAALRRDAIETALGKLLLDQEREHVRGLEQALRTVGGGGGPRATVPDPGLARALADRASFARYALALEEETTRAYVDAAARISRSTLRQPLGSIMTAEAAHAVALRQSTSLPLIVPSR